MAALKGSCRRAVYVTDDVTDDVFDNVTNDVNNRCKNESRDQAPSLPGNGRVATDTNKCVERALACDVTDGTTVTTRLYAKDKRKMREKRRSTGIASYNSSSDRQDCRDDDDEGENVTRRNTWYNETLVITPSDMSAGCSTLSDGLPSSALTTESGTTASVSTTSQYPTLTLTPATTTDRSREVLQISDASIVNLWSNRFSDAAHGGGSGQKKNTPPVVPPKPTTRGRLVDTDWLSRQRRPNNDQVLTTGGQEEPTPTTTLLDRVHALEQMIEEAAGENLHLKDALQVRAKRISELETKVEALNKDLDLANEDYEKLEEENRALVHVVSQLSPC